MTTDLQMDLQELCDAAEDEIGARRIPNPGGRVSDRITGRTVRYYTSLGLVDRPDGYRGGKACYGRRQLLQLLAVRALQADFLPLPEIQKRLFGRSDAELEAMVEARPRTAPVEAAPAVRLLAECPILPGLRLVLDDPRALRERLRRGDQEELARQVLAAIVALASVELPEPQEGGTIP